LFKSLMRAEKCVKDLTMVSFNKKIRVVIYCCGEGFSRIIENWKSLPEVNKLCSIRIHNGFRWVLRAINRVGPSQEDNIETFFFESDNNELFLALVDYLSPEGDWEEVRHTVPVQ